MEFKYDGGGLAKGGDVTLYYDGKSVGKGRVETDPADGLLRRRGLRRGQRHRLARIARLRPDRQRVHRQMIAWVQIDIGDDDHDHLITAEDRFRIAMARQ